MNLPEGFVVFSKEILDKWISADVFYVTADLVDVPLYSYYIKFAVQFIPTAGQPETVYYHVNSDYIQECINRKPDKVAFIVHEDHVEVF